MKRTSFFLIAVFALVTSVASRPVHAQVSDTERAAARKAYVEGDELQRAGKFAEALDRFRRAQRVINAPTNQLRIAQCEAALGKLVESMESYRSVIRAQLPPNPPAAFTQAQEQAKAELPQVESRVPTARIDVTPKDLPNLTVQIDAVSVNAALVGSALPINPGLHKISVGAPGYKSAEQTITLKERENVNVAFNLEAMPGVVYGQLPPQSTTTPTTSAPQQPPTAQQPAQPAKQEVPAYTYPAQEKPKAIPPSLLFGIHAGLAAAGGSAYKINDKATEANKIAGTGGALGLDVGWRFSKLFGVMASFEHQFYSGADAKAIVTDTGPTVTVTPSGNLFSLTMFIVTSPEKFSFYGEIGFAYRWLTLAHKYESGPPNNFKTTFEGSELALGLGMWIPAGKLRLVPKVGLGVGSFSKVSQACDGDSSCTLPTFSPSFETHSFIFLGVNGYFNLGL